MSFSKHAEALPQGGEYEHVVSQSALSGIYREKVIKTAHYQIRDIQAEFSQMLKVDFEDGRMEDYVNICMCMAGTEYEIRFDSSKIRSRLQASRYHFNYIPDSRYQLVLPKKIRTVHLAMNRDYYTNLLNTFEIPTTDLEKNVQREEPFNSGPIQASTAMKNIFMDLFSTPLTGKIKALYIESKVMEIVALQVNERQPSKNLQVLRKRDRDTFQDLKTYLDRSLTEEHSLKSLSTQFGLNEFKLKKGFRELFGTSVFDYLLDQRLTLGKSLLQEGGFRVNEVAARIGYKNANHFSTAFKQKFGLTPKDLKK
ncbi:MAG TPA: AraC family transcriptional regulator [Chryseolinea sp.]